MQELLQQRITLDNGESFVILHNLHTYDHKIDRYIQQFLEKHEPRSMDVQMQSVFCGEIMSMDKRFYAIPENLHKKSNQTNSK